MTAAPRPRQPGSPGLNAVARVRSMREQDSLFGLHGALSQARRDRDRLESLDSRLDPPSEAPSPDGQALASFLEARRAMLAVGAAVVDARGRLDTTESVALAARSRWQHDKTQLDAVSQLMERRNLELRAERQRREARDLDEMAGQRWARNGASR
ncbi:MAG: flagellar FliJ family protein [Actinomycetota bacterium]|nr:flagellar FliJ family protein [Actinomycetota bacterium]